MQALQLEQGAAKKRFDLYFDTRRHNELLSFEGDITYDITYNLPRREPSRETRNYATEPGCNLGFVAICGFVGGLV